MTLRAWLNVYPWDVLDEDPAGLLDLLHGGIGVTGLSLWVASPPLTQLRVHDLTPRVMHSRGGLLFHPQESHYASTRLKPQVSDWARGRHPLERIAKACDQGGIELRVNVSASVNGRLADRHAEMATKNVFEDSSRRSLCLINPDVQAFLVGLLSDLSARDHVTGVTLTDFENAWSEAYRDDLAAPVVLDQTHRALLSICFCESCRQRASQAGLDVDMTVRSVRTMLQSCFEGRTAQTPRLDALRSDQTPLSAWLNWQGSELDSLLRRLVEACRCELTLLRNVAGENRPAVVAIDPSIPAAVLTREWRIERLSEALCDQAARNELLVCPMTRFQGDAPELVALVSKAAELGFVGVEFSGPGMLPESALQSLKQAIRFARRSAVSD